MSEWVYSGFARGACRDWSGVLVEWMRAYLPVPEIDPRCRKNGHRWGKPLTLDWGRSGIVEVQGCIRCAKRGLVVLTDKHEAA